MNELQDDQNGAGKGRPRQAKAEFLTSPLRASDVVSDRTDFLLMLAEAGLTDHWLQSITDMRGLAFLRSRFQVHDGYRRKIKEAIP